VPYLWLGWIVHEQPFRPLANPFGQGICGE
jgi:hypothetical protein